MGFTILVLTLALMIPFAACGHDPVDTWAKYIPNSRMPHSLVVATMKPDINKTRNGKWATSLVEIAYDGYYPPKCKPERVHPPPPARRQGLAEDVMSRFVLRSNLTVGASLAVRLWEAKDGLVTKFATPTSALTLPPFNSSHTEEILGYFSIPTMSRAGEVMQMTLDRCEKFNPIDGRWQHCSTSFEDLLSSVCDRVQCPHVRAISTRTSNKGMIPYLVEQVKMLATDKTSVFCHQLGYPYAIYYCHQPSATTVYSVKLKGLDEEVFVVCHDDTANWKPQHIGFRVTGAKPGTPLCHYLQFHDTVFYEEE